MLGHCSFKTVSCVIRHPVPLRKHFFEGPIRPRQWTAPRNARGKEHPKVTPKAQVEAVSTLASGKEAAMGCRDFGS